MRVCPSCKRELKDELTICPFDGQALAEAAEADPLVNILLDDKYRLDARVGEGGMGSVYRATHVQMEHTVAVKVMHSDLASDQVAVERFRREAKAAAQIRHPNAVAVTDFGVTKKEGIAYLVMEFLEGGDLRRKIKREKRLDCSEAILIMNQACAALNAAHEKGIIHRDLKPDNIWLLESTNPYAQVKVLDFGIAKLKASAEASNLTQKGMIVGTPYYMSPEHCRSEELDPRSDIYSLGIILYEMLAGKVPFEGSSPLQVMYKHNTEQPKPLRQIRPEIPEQIERVVLRALEKRKEDRQSSALELAAELEEALYECGLCAQPSGSKASSITREYIADRQKKEDQTGKSTVAFTAQRMPPPASSKISPAGATVPLGAIRSATPAKSIEKTSQSPAKTTALGDDDLTKADVAIVPEVTLQQTAVGLTAARKPYWLLAVIALVVVAALTWTLRRQLGLVSTVGPGLGGPDVKPSQMGMTLIPGGTFSMGTDDPNLQNDKKFSVCEPAHPVTVSSFYLDQKEVTNEQYASFMRATGNSAPTTWEKGMYPPRESQLPVTNVSWYDAGAYAKWAGKRLPTEAEWEYAARGTKGLIYPWGNVWSEQRANSGEEQSHKPVAVGSYLAGASPFGILDMAGNVSEWVQDDFKLYPGSHAKPQPEGLKVYKGGSFAASRSDQVTYARWLDFPTQTFKDVGFRCAKDGPSN
ncbi:MAG TPA: bifunctional serine/threonine-protein kinase/formylglycine-generating enzyme family protein [Blastocatellia bacterium]|nr:bifunctional serine/threonine-protein kinase/formylglycine-generating enzyme family protein [Blastocatellia bacterium]